MAEKETKVEEKVVEKPSFVQIKIPRLNAEQEDVVVWVNERRFLIKRGVYVSVPIEVAEILEAQDRMLDLAYRYNEAKSSKA